MIMLFIPFYTASQSETLTDPPELLQNQPVVNDMIFIGGNTLISQNNPLTPVFSVREEIVYWANYWGADPFLATSIVVCEGGFDNPEICNLEFGCKAGQGHFMFIPSRWASTIKRMEHKLPEYCRNKAGVFESECNIIAGTWLLATDGDRHWRTWSGSCYLPLYDK